MNNIAIIVRDLPYLKLLTPIMYELHNRGILYNLYYMDCHRGVKEYNNLTKDRLIKSSQSIVSNANKLQSFKNDSQLFTLLAADKIKKAVSVEIGLCGLNYAQSFKTLGIQTFSLSYLTDSLWFKKEQSEALHRIYYTSKYLMELQHKFSGMKFDSKRDRCLGSPIFDQLKSIKNQNAASTLIMLPNQCDASFFGGESGFEKLLKAFGDDLLFKTRKKQWMPAAVKKLGKKVIFDGDVMYPSAIIGAFEKSKNTVLFYSSGVYEAVYANQYVINVKFPLSLWPRDKEKQKEYFLSDIYNYSGVVESVEQTDLSKLFVYRPIDQVRRKEWIEKHIGDVSEDSAKLIVEDILK